MAGIDLPPLEKAEDAARAMATIAHAAATGELTPGEAEALARLVREWRETVALAALEERLSRLEEAQDHVTAAKD